MENKEKKEELSTWQYMAVILACILVIGYFFKNSLISLNVKHNIKHEKLEKYTVEQLNEEIIEAKKIEIVSSKTIKNDKAAVYIYDKRVATTENTGKFLTKEIEIYNYEKDEVVKYIEKDEELVDNQDSYEIVDSNDKVLGYITGATTDYVFFDSNKNVLATAKNINDTFNKDFQIDVKDKSGNTIYKFSSKFDYKKGAYVWKIENLDDSNILSVYHIMFLPTLDRMYKSW